MPFYVCVTTDEAPGEVTFAHPDVDEDVTLGEDAQWKWVDAIPSGAVLGHSARASASGIRGRSAFEVIRALVAGGTKR